MRLAVADGSQPELHTELIEAVIAAAGDLGIEAARVADAAREAEYDRTVLIGYPHLYPAFAGARRPGARRPGARRTPRTTWYGEALPVRPASPAEAVIRAVPFPRLVDIVTKPLALARLPVADRFAAARERAAAERELGRNLAELSRASGWIDSLVVTSENRRRGARLAGWDARVVPFGYQRSLCGPIVSPASGDRDIDVLMLGRDALSNLRRGRLLRELAEAGVRPAIVSHGVYGADRHALLARTRVVLDLHRMPRNASGLRWLMSSAAGAAVVAEAADDEWAARSGTHVIEAAPRDLAAAVRALLGDEGRRAALVESSQRLLTSTLTMSASLARVLDL